MYRREEIVLLSPVKMAVHVSMEHVFVHQDTMGLLVRTKSANHPVKTVVYAIMEYVCV